MLRNFVSLLAIVITLASTLSIFTFKRISLSKRGSNRITSILNKGSCCALESALYDDGKVYSKAADVMRVTIKPAQ
jgi:hypothetical protein